MKLKESDANDLSRLPHQIVQNVVCVKCEREYLGSESATGALADYVDIEVGFTSSGFQVWCRKHDANVLHIDFENKEMLAEFRCFEPKQH